MISSQANGNKIFRTDNDTDPQLLILLNHSLRQGTVEVYFSTSLPASVKSKMHFSFGFEVIMFKEKKGVDDFYLDFPVALVSYNAKTKVFENNYNYTNHIKKKIKESEKNTNLKTTFSK